MSSDPYSPKVRDVPSKGGVGCFGAILGLVVVGVWYTLVPKNNVHGIVPLTAASLVLLAIALIAGWRNHASPYRAILHMSVIMLALGTFVGFSAQFARNFIDNGCDSFPDGRDLIFRSDLVVSFFHGLGTAFALVFSGTLAFRIARDLVQRRVRWLEPALHTASRYAFGGMVCLLLTVAPRAFLLPFPDRYVESLPIVAMIQLDALKEPTRAEGEDVQLDIFDIPVADFVVRSVCAHDRPSQCVITAGQPVVDAFRMREGRSYAQSLGLVETAWERGALCNPNTEFTVERTSVVIREDRARGLVFIDGETPSHGRIRRAARLSSGIDHVSLRDIADSTSPPQGRLAAALAGFALSGWFLHRRRRNARRHAELVGAHAGFLGENGWIEFIDAKTNVPPIRVGQDEGLVPGPVLVLPRQPTKVPQGPYRGEMYGAHGEIICGYRVELLVPVEDEMLIHSSLALAVVVLTAMPLLAAIDFWFLR